MSKATVNRCNYLNVELRGKDMFFLSSRYFERNLSAAELKRLLVDDRKTSSYLDCRSDFLNGLAFIRRNTDNWVRTWVDLEHQIIHRDGRRIAKRAITDSGQLIWMVETKGKKHAYHADALNLDDAFLQAEKAYDARRSIARRWNDIVSLRRQVLLGSIRLSATVEDARSAGLCELGIQGFLHRIGYGGRTQVPGRLLMLLSYFDKQVAYAVYVAYLRQERARTGL